MAFDLQLYRGASTPTRDDLAFYRFWSLFCTFLAFGPISAAHGSTPRRRATGLGVGLAHLAVQVQRVLIDGLGARKVAGGGERGSVEVQRPALVAA